MGLYRFRRAHVLCALVSLLPALQSAEAWEPTSAGIELSRNDSGVLETVNINGRTDTRGAFFQSLGTNGRSCATCHVADQAMSISPPQIRQRYERTNGRDPLFAAVDGANCPDARPQDRSGHSLLLKHGLIRVGIDIPANAQFSITAVHDPYGCALTINRDTGLLTASVYRRPLPAANLSFLSTVMWDGRETLVPLNNGDTFLANLRTDLNDQVVSAVLGHAEGKRAPRDKQIAEIVDFELGIYTAQVVDRSAERLDRDGASGGASALSNQQYFPGINDVLGADPTHAAFNPNGMTLYTVWSRNTRDYGNRARARRDIAAGEALFNSAPLTISNVRGLNDSAALNHAPSFAGTCTTCHDTPNVGHHSLPLPLDIGVAHSGKPGFESDPAIAKAVAELDMPNLPVFLIQGCPSPFNPGQPASFYTTDPGKALLTGQCADFNRLKGPVLRGLAGRAPFFHNGSAASLADVVSFYNQRFAMNLTQRQKEQLALFLGTL